MADSEKNTNLDVNNTDNIATNEATGIDISKLPQEEPKINAENPPEDTESPGAENSDKSGAENLETTVSSESSFKENLPMNSSAEEATTQSGLNENLNIKPEETINTDNLISGESNMPTNTINEAGINPNSEILQNQLLDHPVVLNNVNLNPEEQEKTKLSQKEKLAQLIKIHESKAQKSGFIRGFLSGIALIAILVFASFILAKDQILNILNDGNNQSLSASIVNLSEDETNNNEDKNLSSDENTSSTEEIIENEENQIYDEASKYKGIVYEENEEEVYAAAVPYEEYEEIENEEINNNDENTENEINEDTEPTDETNEDKSIEIDEVKNTKNNEAEKLYTITPVLSEETANWVLPAHCSDLTCYGEDKEFTPCTSFRLSENLNDNANRIGKKGVCKYKDPSELVLVEFLDEEDESNQDNNMEDKKRARDVTRKTALSQLQSAIVTSQGYKGVWPGMDKGAKEGITMSVIEKEVKEAGMNSIPMDPNIFNINYGLGTNYKDDSAIGEYLYLVTKRNGAQNGGFLLMAKTEVPGGSNWLVCKDGTGLDKGYIDNETDIAKIKLCTTVTQGNSCEINEGNCTYTSEDELRYIVLY